MDGVAKKEGTGTGRPRAVAQSMRSPGQALRASSIPAPRSGPVRRKRDKRLGALSSAHGPLVIVRAAAAAGARPLRQPPIFVSVLRAVDPARRTRVALREVTIAFAALALFMGTGQGFLRPMLHFERSLEATGGVILLAADRADGPAKPDPWRSLGYGLFSLSRLTGA